MSETTEIVNAEDVRARENGTGSPDPAAVNVAEPAHPAAPSANTPGLDFAPLFILAPPRSLTSVVCAMLGEHPQMYGVCEVHLGPARTIAHWWRVCEAASFGMSDGLLRVVAELQFGGQTEQDIAHARGWLRRRSHWTSGFMLEEISRRVLPRILVDKSPSLVYRIEYMKRTLSMFPQARFLHLARHPISHGDSVIRALREAEKYGPAPYWMLNLASFPYRPKSQGPESVLNIDPQRGWYELHSNITEFLKLVPKAQQLRVRAEDLMREPDHLLAEIAVWLGLRTDAEAIDRMKHPERSPYARFGPPNAPMGNDGFFLANPKLRPERAPARSLDEPLSWFEDHRGLSPRVKLLASQFGYT